MSLKPALYYCTHAATVALVLAALPPFHEAPLRVPVTYEGDGLFFTALVKAVSEDGPLYASRIGAPFGSDLVDWPVGMWVPLAVMAGITRVSGEAGTAINLYWLGSVVVAGALAAWSLRRLRVSAGLAFAVGVLFGLLPYAFYRNVAHVNLAFPFVPPIALLCLRTAGTRPEDETRTERWVTTAACAAQALSYVYYTFFACILLAAAAPLGWLRTRQARLPRRALATIVLLAVFTAAALAPSVAYWSQNGRNPDLDYKGAAETDTLGLKLRHLVTPIVEHPLPPLRAIAERVAAAAFPGDNENTFARLGTLGTLGLLVLLGLAVGRAAGLGRGHDADLDGAAALTLVTLLVSLVGGIGSLFSVLVSPDIRAYNRIVVFIAFFSLFAAAVTLSRLAARMGVLSRIRRPVRLAALAGLVAFGVIDQVPLVFLSQIRAGGADRFAEDRAWVRSIERRLPSGAMVFQLPHSTIPLDTTSRPPAVLYDQGRAFLHSRSLAWSWGSVIGRTNDWQAAVASLPAREMATQLAAAGFAGLWIDRWGYLDRRPGGYEALESELSDVVHRAPLVSQNGRYSFLSLEGYGRELEGALGAARFAAVREQALNALPVLKWREGCSEERPAADGWWRSCDRDAWFVLRNPGRRELEVTLTARFRAADATRGRVKVSLSGTEDEELELGPEPSAYRRVIVMAESQRLKVRLGFEGGSGCCFLLGDVKIATRRLAPRALGPVEGDPEPDEEAQP